MTTNEPTPQEWALTLGLDQERLPGQPHADVDRKTAEPDIAAMRARLSEAVNACTDLAMDQAVLILENHRLHRLLKEAQKPSRPHLHAPVDPGPDAWSPQPNADGELTLGDAVGQALGSASMCWIGGPGSLEFDSVQAARVFDGLMVYLANYHNDVWRKANEATALKLLEKERWA